MSVCRWDGALVPPDARRDAIYCSKACRQAAHRAKVRRADQLANASPKRLAYADPPYIGLAERYYADHPDFAGEVDHGELLDRLATYDGWALSCSSRSVPAIAALLVARGSDARIAVWHRRRPDGWVATRWEGVIYQPARTPDAAVSDVLLDVDARPRATLPSSVTGMKPPAFIEWMFALLGARPGDAFDDLFPGSGMVLRSWRAWAGEHADGSWQPPLLSSLETADASVGARGDA